MHNYFAMGGVEFADGRGWLPGHFSGKDFHAYGTIGVCPTYLNVFFILTKDTFLDHLDKLQVVLKRLLNISLHVNCGKV